MDWAPVEEPFIEGLYLRDFQYDKPLAKECHPPTVLRCQGGTFGSTLLQEDSDWDEWFESEVFKCKHLDSKSNPGNRLSGFHLLILPCTEPIISRSLDGSLLPPVPRPHYHLPLKPERWEKITKAFKLHRAIIHATTYNKCHSTFLPYKDGKLALELHTAVAASYDRPESFSLSCTYFEKSKLSLAVLYGCNANQVMRVTELLETSPEVACHPWLMVGVFAELQLSRMQDLVYDVHRVCDPNKSNMLTRLYSTRSGFQVWDLYNQLLKTVAKAREVEEEVQVTRAQLKVMADRFVKKIERWEKRQEEKRQREQRDRRDDQSTLSPEQVDPRDARLEAADRFINRFRDIDVELNGLMTQCRVAAEEQTQVGEIFMSEVAREEARASRVQASKSNFLATIATLYLPITSVATIFAVPAFKFENWWVDASFHPAMDGSSKPVFSGYGVIYIVISIFMTGITFLAYRWGNWRAGRGGGRSSAALAEEGQARRVSMSSSGSGGSPDSSWTGDNTEHVMEARRRWCTLTHLAWFDRKDEVEVQTNTVTA